MQPAKKINNKIETTGQLREFLCMMLVGVKDGTVDLDAASRITKLAGQVNESFYSEVKVGRVRADMGETVPRMGQMSIGTEILAGEQK
jgi:hypothetical protein